MSIMNVKWIKVVAFVHFLVLFALNISVFRSLKNLYLETCKISLHEISENQTWKIRNLEKSKLQNLIPFKKI